MPCVPVAQDRIAAERIAAERMAMGSLATDPLVRLQMAGINPEVDKILAWYTMKSLHFLGVGPYTHASTHAP